MNFQQLRFVREIVRQGFSVSAAAHELRSSQPGVSKAVGELEEELAFRIFERRGKRLVGLSEPGRAVIETIHKLLEQAENLQRIGLEYVAQDQGRIAIAATHTQARYKLPDTIATFKREYPKVSVSIHQGTPEQIAHWVLDGSADLGFATESVTQVGGLATLEWYAWQHMLVTPADHELAHVKKLSLAKLAAYPLVTYDKAFTGRLRIDKTFTLHGLAPDVVLEAIDSDVLKTYVQLGMGVGLLAEMAISEEDRKRFHVRPVGELFGHNTTRIALKRGVHRRLFVYRFIELISPKLKRHVVERALEESGEA